MNWQKYEFQTVYQPEGKTKKNLKNYIFGPALVGEACERIVNMSNERILKLIWDFRGPDAATTAAHHATHLQEFSGSHRLSQNISGSEKISDAHAIAFLVVTESEMPSVRDALKPHRGQLYTT